MTHTERACRKFVDDYAEENGLTVSHTAAVLARNESMVEECARADASEAARRLAVMVEDRRPNAQVDEAITTLRRLVRKYQNAKRYGAAYAKYHTEETR